MKKLLLLLFALLGTAGAWATVTQPTLTTDPDNPTYYYIKNVRSQGYAQYTGASAQLAQESSLSVSSLWYFMESGDGVNIVPAADPSVKMATYASATTEGATWYLVENPYNNGFFCVSLTNNASANCWDDQSSKIGYWRPAEGDYTGTSWSIEEVPVTKADVDGGDIAWGVKKAPVIVNLKGLSGLSAYAEAIAAIKNAADEAELATALTAFNTSITLYCRSGRYLQIGESAASYIAAPGGYEHAILIESVGDGSFYLKGYLSEKYLGDVTTSEAITTTTTPEPYYI